MCLAVTGAKSQIHQPFRYEKEREFSESGFTIISLKEEGLALIRDTDKFEQNKRKWLLEILDTTLTTTWSTELILENRLTIVGYEYYRNHLYLLFREGESNHFGFKLLTVLFKDQQIRTQSVQFDIDFRITHFTMAGGSAVFGGYVNNEPAVLLYDQKSDQPKVLPGLFVSDIKLLDVRTNQNQSFNVLLSEHKGRDDKKLIVRTYDPDGNLLLDDIIDFDRNLSILTGLTSTLERDELIIAGTYGEGSFRHALGFYSVVVDPFNRQEITYTDFSMLHHFLDYLPEKKAEKIREKKKNEKTAGNLSDFKAYVMPFRIEESNKGFFLLSEVYIPSQSSSPYPYNSSFYNPYLYGYNPYGFSPYMNRYYNSPYSGYNTVNSSEYKMVQSMVVRFNSQAKIEKDFSMKFDDLRENQLEQVSDFSIRGDSLVMMYKNENQIFYLKSAGEINEKNDVSQIKVALKNDTEAIKGDNRDEGFLRYWYGHHLYTWGYQTINNQNHKRHVFYVNRISLD